MSMLEWSGMAFLRSYGAPQSALVFSAMVSSRLGVRQGQNFLGMWSASKNLF
jgi:hypothetical protein